MSTQYILNWSLYCAGEGTIPNYLFILIQHIATVADKENYNPDIIAVYNGFGEVVFNKNDFIIHVESNPSWYNLCKEETLHELELFKNSKGILFHNCYILNTLDENQISKRRKLM